MNSFRLRSRVDCRPAPLPRRRRIELMMWAISCAVGLVSWAVWLSLAARPVFPSQPGDGELREVPEVSFLRSDGVSLPEEDVRVIRSPILFSLPSPQGFSAILINQSMSLPAPSLREEPLVFLQPEPDFKAGAFGETSRRMGQLVAHRRPYRIPELDADPVILAAAPRAADPGFQIYWMDRPDEPLMNLSPADINETPGDLPWDALFYVCVDQNGWVKSIMAERPAPLPSFNQALVRRLRSLTFARPQGKDCGRLVVHFQPPPTTQAGN